MPVLRATEPCGRARRLSKLKKRYRKLPELRGNKDRSLSIFETNSSTWENREQNETATADLLAHFFRPIKYERQVYIISHFPLLTVGTPEVYLNIPAFVLTEAFMRKKTTSNANERRLDITVLLNQWSEDRCRYENYI
jgi:hypothetical protein